MSQPRVPARRVFKAVVIDVEGLPEATVRAEQALRAEHGDVAIVRLPGRFAGLGAAWRALGTSEAGDLLVLPFRTRYLVRPGYWQLFAAVLGRSRNACVAADTRLLHPLIPVLWALPFLFPLVSLVLIVRAPLYLFRQVIAHFFLSPEDPADPIVAFGGGRAAGGVTYWNLLADKARRYGVFGLAHDTYMGKPLSVHSWPLALGLLRVLRYRAYTALSLLLLAGALAWAAAAGGELWFIALLPLMLTSTFLSFNFHVGTWELLAWGLAALSIVAMMQGHPMVAGALVGLTLLAHPGVAQLGVMVLVAGTVLPTVGFVDLAIAGVIAVPVAMPFLVPYWRARRKLGRGRILNSVTRPEMKWDPASLYQLLLFTALAAAYWFSPAPREALAMHVLPPLVHFVNTKVQWIWSNYTVFNLALVLGAVHLASWGGPVAAVVWLLVIFTPAMALFETPFSPLAGLPLDPITLGETGRRLQRTFGRLTAGRVAFENDGISTDMSSAVATITYAVRDLPIELLNAAYAEIGDAEIYFKYVRPLNAPAERDELLGACRGAGVKYVVAFTEPFRRRLEEYGLKEIAREESLALAHYPNRGTMTLTVHEIAGDPARVQPPVDLQVEPNRIRFQARAGVEYRLSYSAFAGWRATLDGIRVPIEDAHPGMIVRAGRDGLVELRYRYRHYFGL